MANNVSRLYTALVNVLEKKAQSIQNARSLIADIDAEDEAINAARDELAAYARSKQLDGEDLDDAVHDEASHAGTDANNGGIESQVEFLLGDPTLQDNGVVEARERVRKIIDEVA